MRSFNDFAIEKTLREFRSFIETESHSHPEAFEIFIESHRIDEFWGWGKKKSKQDDSKLPIAASDGKPAIYPGRNDPRDPIAATRSKPAVYPGDDGSGLPVAATRGKPAIYPGENDPKMPMAGGGSKPAVYPGQNDPNVPYGHEMPNDLASKTVSTSIKAFTDNILKSAKQRSPSNVGQIEQMVKGFHDQWVAFKRQIIPLLGARGVKNPEKHGLTYGVA